VQAPPAFAPGGGTAAMLRLRTALAQERGDVQQPGVVRIGWRPGGDTCVPVPWPYGPVWRGGTGMLRLWSQPVAINVILTCPCDSSGSMV